MVARLRFWAALAGLVASLAILVLVGMGWRAHRDLSARPQEVLDALSQAVGLPVEADAVEGTWWPPGVLVRGLRIPDVSSLGPGTLVHAQEARLSVEVLPLLSGGIVVDGVEVASPVVRLVRGVDGDWNLAGEAKAGDVGAAPPGSSGAGSRFSPTLVELPRFDVANVVLTRGRLSLRDRGIPGVPELEVSSVDARLEWNSDEGTLGFQGDLLDGPAGNLRGRMRIAAGSGEVTLEMSVGEVPASRLSEVMKLLRGRIPFGSVLDGVVSSDIEATFPRAWPPSEVEVEVQVDASQAGVSIANGYIQKLPGVALGLTLELAARAELLQLRSARLTSGDARIDIEVPSTARSEATRQPALRVASSALDARVVAQWVPLLTTFAPVGDLALQGTIAPVDGTSAIRLLLSGVGLRARLAGESAQIAALGLDLDVRPSGRITAGASLENVRADTLYARRLSAAFDGGGEHPSTIRIDGARGGRAEAELERVAIDCALEDGRVEVRRLDVSGLGGRLRATGEVRRFADEALEVRLNPQWEGVEFASFFRLFGTEVDLSGASSGRASLSAREDDEVGFLQTLRGVFEADLKDGALPEINLARATVDELDAVPGLRRAVEKRLREELPGLLEETSRIQSLSVDGSFGDSVVAVSRADLQTAEYSVAATGEVGFDGRVDLGGDLVLGAGATRALERGGGVLSVLKPKDEVIRIPVTIEGTYPDLVSAPSPAFVSSSLGGLGGGRGARDLLRRFFGGRSDDEEP